MLRQKSEGSFHAFVWGGVGGGGLPGLLCLSQAGQMIHRRRSQLAAPQ